MSLKAKEYLGFEVLEGEEGNSFYGSRFGSSFCCSVEVWFSVDQDSTDIRFCGFFCGSSTITTTATSTATATATATAERLFEALRVYCLVILSTDRGLVVLRFPLFSGGLVFVVKVVDF